MNKVIALLLSLAAMCLLLAACINTEAKSALPDEISLLKTNGYLNEFENKKDTHDEITVRVKYVASDGIKTYVAIAVDGNIPSVETDEIDMSTITMIDAPTTNVHGKNEKSDGIVRKSIREAKLSDDNSNVWNFSSQETLGFTGAATNEVRPFIGQQEQYSKANEAILVFYNTEFSDSVHLNIELEFYGIAEKFIINDMQCKIAPVKTRDLRANLLSYHAPLANMKLISLKSSLLETIVTIEWDLSPDFSHIVQFFNDQQIVFDCGESSISSFMFFPTISPLSGNKNAVMTRSHSIAGSIPLDKEIKVTAFDTASQSKTAEMFVIPAE